jgi:hypothetical protein
MICFRDADAVTILAALEHYRVESHRGRMQCGADTLRGNFIAQEDEAARLVRETREQMI